MHINGDRPYGSSYLEKYKHTDKSRAKAKNKVLGYADLPIPKNSTAV